MKRPVSCLQTGRVTQQPVGPVFSYEYSRSPGAPEVPGQATTSKTRRATQRPVGPELSYEYDGSPGAPRYRARQRPPRPGVELAQGRSQSVGRYRPVGPGWLWSYLALGPDARRLSTQLDFTHVITFMVPP